MWTIVSHENWFHNKRTRELILSWMWWYFDKIRWHRKGVRAEWMANEITKASSVWGMCWHVARMVWQLTVARPASPINNGITVTSFFTVFWHLDKLVSHAGFDMSRHALASSPVIMTTASGSLTSSIDCKHVLADAGSLQPNYEALSGALSTHGSSESRQSNLPLTRKGQIS